MDALDIRGSEPDNGFIRCQHLMPMQQRFHGLTLLILLFLCAFYPQGTAQAQTRAQAQFEQKRIVSLNYCYDQLLLGLIEASVIERDRTLLLEQHGGRLETIVRWQPDIVLANAFNSVHLLNRLRDQGIDVKNLPEPHSREQALRFKSEFHTTIGIDVARTQSQSFPLTEDLPTGESPAGQLSAVLFQPNQFSWGRHSLFGDLLNDVGLFNLASQHGDGLVHTSLEHIVHWKPDFIILDSYTENFALAGVAQGHRALANLDAEILVMPVDLSGCLGQRYTEARNWLREHIH